MTPQRFQQIRNIYEAAIERTPGERAQFVADACRDDSELQAEVARLLEAQAATVTLREPPVRTDPASRTDPTSREGTCLGPYELLRQLGRGGMGSVYLARRADDRFHRYVAVKILRADSASADILRRFQREREILAQLDHPNIARLLDAGETPDGLPYFVMEFVEGRNIIDYADEHRLTIPQRLELFRQVCDAVDYAHQRKIVHRDLKPSNVLVTTEGQVKLLDFGIARLTEQDTGSAALTRTGMWLMTPEYASPEQIRGEVANPSSDVYSLGVILFELLTGHRPYQLRSRVFHEIVRVICEEPPTRPSQAVSQPVETVNADGKPATLPAESASRLRQTSLTDLKQQLTGNLDNILLKALDKQPQARYSSAIQFRADLDRHLKGESIWARGESPLRGAGRFASKHRVALVIAATLIAASATGAIRLQWSAVAWVLAAAALIGLWHAATDPKAGRRLAELSVPRFLYFSLVFMIAMLPLYGPKSWGPAFLAVSGVSLLGCLGLLFYWLLRGRWAGPLLLKIGSTWGFPYALLGFNLFTLFFNTLVLLRLHPHRLPSATELAYLLCMLAIGALMIVTAHQEIRRDGIYTMGRLIRWNRIAAWSWQDESFATAMTWPRAYPVVTTVFGGSSRNAFLVLDLHHAVQFLPPARLLIPKEKIEEVEALLKRELGEWPGTAA